MVVLSHWEFICASVYGFLLFSFVAPQHFWQLWSYGIRSCGLMAIKYDCCHCTTLLIIQRIPFTAYEHTYVLFAAATYVSIGRRYAHGANIRHDDGNTSKAKTPEKIAGARQNNLQESRMKWLNCATWKFMWFVAEDKFELGEISRFSCQDGKQLHIYKYCFKPNRSESEKERERER